MAEAINRNSFIKDLVNVRDCKERIKERTGLDLTDRKITQICKETGVTVFNIGNEKFIHVQEFENKLPSYCDTAVKKFSARSKKLESSNREYQRIVRALETCILILFELNTSLKEDKNSNDNEEFAESIVKTFNSVAPRAGNDPWTISNIEERMKRYIDNPLKNDQGNPKKAREIYDKA